MKISRGYSKGKKWNEICTSGFGDDNSRLYKDLKYRFARNGLINRFEITNFSHIHCMWWDHFGTGYWFRLFQGLLPQLYLPICRKSVWKSRPITNTARLYVHPPPPKPKPPLPLTPRRHVGVDARAFPRPKLNCYSIFESNLQVLSKVFGTPFASIPRALERTSNIPLSHEHQHKQQPW